MHALFVVFSTWLCLVMLLDPLMNILCDILQSWPYDAINALWCIVGRMRLEYFDKISCAHTLRCRGQTARHLTRDQLALAMTGPFQFLSFLSSTFSFLDFFFLFFSWGLYSWRGCFQSPWLFLGVGRYVRRTSRYIFCVLTKRIIRCPLTKLVSNPSSYIATDFVFVFASGTAIT